ncbi:MAG: hypothetical protein ACI82Z_001712 [Cellvibrionaceae bacterium]|jgi:hypothetical protein
MLDGAILFRGFKLSNAKEFETAIKLITKD